MTHPTLDKIDRDEALDRTYIPLPGGWEIQTKGKFACEAHHAARYREMQGK